MALVAITARTSKMPMGPYWMQTFTTDTSGIAQTAEWIDTEFNNIAYVVGSAVQGDVMALATTNFAKNAEGTITTADAGPGLLGFEVSAAHIIEVTIIGT